MFISNSPPLNVLRPVPSSEHVEVTFPGPLQLFSNCSRSEMFKEISGALLSTVNVSEIDLLLPAKSAPVKFIL